MKFIAENWEIIFAIVSPIITFFATKGIKDTQLVTLKEELESVKIINVSKNLEIYQEIINDLNSKFKERITEYSLEIEELKTLNEELRKLVKDQGLIITRLEEKLAQYEKLEK